MVGLLSRRSWRENAWLWVAGVVWALAVVTGFAVVMAYKSHPGDAGKSPVRWPAQSAFERAHDRPTLIMFAHPRCACTRASLSELDRMLSRLPERPLVYVSFLLPAGTGADWRQTDLWRSAEHIDGVRVFADVDGREAARFSTETSGTTLVYDASGQLVFSGGLTTARGHEGNSFGQERLVAVLSGLPPDRRDSPVFGCSLHDPTTIPPQGEAKP